MKIAKKKIVEIHYKNRQSVKTTHRKISDIFGSGNCPSENLVDKFESSSSVHNLLTTRICPCRSTENIAAVSKSVKEDPNSLIPRHSQQLGTSTTWQIFRKDMYLKPSRD